MIGLEACPRLFGKKGGKIKNAISRLLLILHKRKKNGPCCYPVLESDSRDVRRQRTKYAVVGLKFLIGGEVAQGGGVNLELYRSGGSV